MFTRENKIFLACMVLVIALISTSAIKTVDKRTNDNSDIAVSVMPTLTASSTPTPTIVPTMMPTIVPTITPTVKPTVALKKETSRHKNTNIVMSSAEKFKLTAYDLSVKCCGKSVSHPGFGIAASGENLKNQDIRDRKIAVDPKKIPFGSKVYIKFPENFKEVRLKDGTIFKLDGVYTATDKGGAVKNNRIDLFVGGWDKFSYSLAIKIGLRDVTVYKIE